MKRSAENSPGLAAKKTRPGSLEPPSLTLDGALPQPDAAASASAAVAALLAHAPGLAAPPPRCAWGLDRLVLDDRCGEAELHRLLRLGGGELLEAPALTGARRRKGELSAGRCCRPLVRCSVLSLPGGAGQGMALAVGLAIGQAHLAASYGGEGGIELFSHKVFVLAKAGALLSGVASEACSLAGHLQLPGLVVLGCEDGLLDTEDTPGRFEAYGWKVAKVLLCAGDELAAALQDSQGSERPTLILVRAGSGAAAACSSPSAEICTAWVRHGAAAAEEWLGQLRRFGESNKDEHAELLRRFAGELPETWCEGLPEYHVGERAQATRQYSAKVLGCLASVLPEMVGGSADLTGSNLTNQAQLKDFQHKRHKGRYLRFGVREHAMFGICTGLSAYGGFIPFCGTFLNFFTYGWGALRVACQNLAHVIYVATHDSIELGEDGPTHQPIEVIPALRALPNLLTLRPCDGPETVGAYKVAMRDRAGPVLLALCRSGVHTLEGSRPEGVARGGYILSDFDPALVPAVVLAASGTEVETCAEARAVLGAVGVGVRVVSMPCWELFEEQDAEYRSSMWALPDSHSMPSGFKPLRVYVEASATLGFHRYAEVHVGMTTFGASGPAKEVRKHFGFEKNAIASRAMEALKERGHVLSYRVGRFGFCRFKGALAAAASAQ